MEGHKEEKDKALNQVVLASMRGFDTAVAIGNSPRTASKGVKNTIRTLTHNAK